ncbi:Endothelin-converting enzyme 1 [Trichoplax sp. H2]|nr:Endothelin-converting enzyme 1 [Trichoplax sp. H2]|eukprot:RDD44025.1 Endothelin-converting enzyme 1 [Trichoplax sp. H2]
MDKFTEKTPQGNIHNVKVEANPNYKLKRLIYSLFVVVILLGLVVAGLAVFVVFNSKAHVQNDVCTTQNCYQATSDILAYINESVDPCHDFYSYACGRWLANNPIPVDRPRHGTLYKIIDKKEMILRRLLERTAAAATNDGERKAIMYFKSCMQDIFTQTESRKDLIAMIRRLGGWNVIPTLKPADMTNWDYNSVMAQLSAKYDVDTLFSIWVGVDLRNSNVTIIEMTQSGLSLPNIEFYFKPDAQAAVQALIEYMTDIAMHMGATDRNRTREKMTEVYRFEQNVAKTHIHKLNKRNETLFYNKVNLSAVENVCPEIDFNSYLKLMFGRVIPYDEPVINYAMNYFKRMNDLLTNTTKETLNNYLIWHFVKTFAPAADSYLQAAFNRYNLAIGGRQTTGSQGLICSSRTDAALGMAVGAMFVKDSFPGQSRTTAIKMVEDIRNAFIAELPNLFWMDNQTRSVAADKARAVIAQVGYPAFILNGTRLSNFYANFSVNDSYYFINTVRRRAYALQLNIARLGKPYDKKAWIATPSTVNAFYSPPRNRITIPAGILQSPVYSNDYLRVLNYGAIGSAIGHEFTHGFDNIGGRYDKDGNLRQWWSDKILKNFNQKSQCLVNQYSNYTYFGLNLRGYATLSENIADNGGLGQSYRAYQKYVKAYGPEKQLPGIPLTNEQLFFTAFARVWCTADKEYYGKYYVSSNVHSPPKFRVLGTLRNSVEFANAFKCPLGSPMNPVKKCKVW